MAKLIDYARLCGLFVSGEPHDGCIVSRRLCDAPNFSVVLLDDTWKRFASESDGPTAGIWTFPAERWPRLRMWIYYARNGRRT